MARPQKPAQDAAPVSRRVLVNIKRDQTTSTPRVVWQHEVPILEGIFGEGNVAIVPPETLDEGYTTKAAPDLLVHNKKQDTIRKPSQSLGIGFAFVGDPSVEYERLGACYGMHPEVKQSWVENVFGRFQSGTFSKMFARPDLEDLPEDQLRALLLDWGYSLPIVGFDSSPAEREAHQKAVAAFNALPKAELVKAAEELGVEV